LFLSTYYTAHSYTTLYGYPQIIKLHIGSELKLDVSLS